MGGGSDVRPRGSADAGPGPNASLGSAGSLTNAQRFASVKKEATTWSDDGYVYQSDTRK